MRESVDADEQDTTSDRRVRETAKAIGLRGRTVRLPIASRLGREQSRRKAHFCCCFTGILRIDEFFVARRELARAALVGGARTRRRA